MRKTDTAGKLVQGVLLPAYGRKKLLGYADSFQDLAKTYTYKGASEETDEKGRQDQMLRWRLMEDREILAENLNEVSRIIRSLAEESCHVYPLGEREKKKLVHTCREKGILVESAWRLEDEIRGLRLALSVGVDERYALTAEDVAEVLSGFFHRRLLPEKDSLFFLSDEPQTVVFEEEGVYIVMTGAAKATREGEKVSGDTYAFIEKGNGNLIMALSDGMGSGEKAMADSEAVIDLLEKLTESGFSKETAAEMINGVLVARSEEENLSTLDMCDVDLYTGVCELMKIGSSYTYIKQGDMVEQIAAQNLPLGVFHRMDADRQKRQLQDGDHVILVSDGIVDGVGSGEILRELIGQMHIQNPQEMANYILQFVLHKTMGKVLDDMTVLVLGIWENGKRMRS